MSTVKRRALLAAALATSLAATRWVASQDASVVETARTHASEVARERTSARAAENASRPVVSGDGTTPAQAADLPVEKLRRAPAGLNESNLFATSTWEPPTPVAARRQAPPPSPSAPPPPYSYFGRQSEGGHTTVFLRGGERSYAVRIGDVLDGRYRIEDIKDATMVLTYIPLQQEQILSLRP